MKKTPASRARWALPAAAVAMALLAIPARGDDTLFLEARTLSHGGDSLLVILPDGRILTSRTMASLCMDAMADAGEVLELNLDGRSCRASSGAANEHPVLCVDDLPSFDSVADCLSAHFAVLEDDTSGLPICFRWFRCSDLALAILGPGQLCEGESIELDAGGGFESYLWSPGGETSRTITVSPYVDTLYGVDLMDDWGCEGFAFHLVMVDPAPGVTISGPMGVCPGASTVLDAGPGFASYLWSPGGQTTPTIEVAPAITTDYSVTVTDAARCSWTLPDHRVDAWQSPTPAISGPSVVVLGETVTLEAGGGYLTYLWSTGQTTQSIQVSPMASTNFEVTVTSGYGCSGTSLEHHIEVIPAGAAVFSDDFETGDTNKWSGRVG